MMLFLYTVLAQAQDKAPTTPPQGGASGFEPMLLILALVVLFYLIVIRPARRQEQERNSMLHQLAKNDRVLTTAGIYGTIVAIADKEDEIIVKVDDNVRLKMVKASIARNFTKEEALKEAKEEKHKTPNAPAGAIKADDKSR